jgi:prepilin-type processing-associated H-X9-DG protein
MRPARNGFTIVEFMVLFGIVIILLSIFIPYLLKAREDARRTRCAQNLYQIRDALKNYAADNGHIYPRVVYDEKNNPNGYTAFTGVDDENPFAANSTVQPNDVTASLWLLVRGGQLNPAVFVCPSSSDSRDLVTDAAARHVKPTQRGNFRSASNLSYSYFSPFSSAINYRIDDARPADTALMADKSPGINPSRLDDITGPAWNAPPLDLARANSRNHGKAGQNVLFGDGHVFFERTVYCAVGRSGSIGGDNIYTALAPQPLSGEHPPANGNGYWGHDIGPAWEGDSYLVPTAIEGMGRPGPRVSVTKPATTTRESASTTTVAVPAPPAATTIATAATSQPVTVPTTSTAPSQ